MAYLLASAHMALGEAERAYELLESVVRESKQPAWRQLPWDPIWDPIRTEERFVRILELMNLS